MKNISKNKSNGFVGMVFLSIALIGIAIAAIASMSRQPTTGAAQEALKSNVAVLLKQAADIKFGFDRMVVDGVVSSAYEITIDSDPTTGLFRTVGETTYAVSHIPPRLLGPATLINPLGFNYNTVYRLPGIGSVTGDDYLISTQIKDLDTCNMINHVLYRDPISSFPASSNGTSTTWAARYGTDDDSANVMLNFHSRPEGCVRAGDGEYVYYKTLIEG